MWNEERIVACSQTTFTRKAFLVKAVWLRETRERTPNSEGREGFSESLVWRIAKQNDATTLLGSSLPLHALHSILFTVLLRAPAIPEDCNNHDKK